MTLLIASAKTDRRGSYPLEFLASGIVVLICIAIATGLIFLFVLLIVLIALWRRRSDERNSAQQADPKASFMGRDSFSDHHARGSCVSSQSSPSSSFLA